MRFLLAPRRKIRALVQCDAVFIKHRQDFRVIEVDPELSVLDAGLVVNIDGRLLDPLIQVNAQIDRATLVDAHTDRPV